MYALRRSPSWCLAARGLAAQARARAGALAVAAASDLQSVMPALAARFERETSRRVTLTFGSSGNFFSQIQNGAPFDLFFSADVDYPRRLEAAGLTEPGTLQPYAIGRLVLYAQQGVRRSISGAASLS